jgi:hypothetical protein
VFQTRGRVEKYRNQAFTRTKVLKVPFIPSSRTTLQRTSLNSGTL